MDRLRFSCRLPKRAGVDFALVDLNYDRTCVSCIFKAVEQLKSTLGGRGRSTRCNTTKTSAISTFSSSYQNLCFIHRVFMIIELHLVWFLSERFGYLLLMIGKHERVLILVHTTDKGAYLFSLNI